jgi:hypothetical protein
MEDRRRERLRDWLARPSWTPYESHLLLAGLDPELTGDIRKGGWWLLPRIAAEPDDRDLDDAEMQQRIEATAGLGLATMKPPEAIKAAYDAGLIIPWLLYALDDPECRRGLPDDLREQEERRRRASEGIAVRNMKTRERHEQFRAAMVAHARAVIADLMVDGQFPPNLMRGEKPWKAEIIRRIRNSWSGTYVGPRTIYDWITDGILKL